MSEYASLPGNHVDAHGGMVARREVNNLAVNPVDFYLESFLYAQRYTTLGPDDAVLDVGCNSGRFIVEAAQATNTPSYLLGLDPDLEAYTDFFPLHLDRSRFTFMQGYGESIPLPDDSVRMTTAHNTLFRVRDAFRVMEEMKRVTEPGQLIMVSTNAVDHAYWRHRFEDETAQEVGRRLGFEVDPLKAPADGYYFDDMPEFVNAVGGLEIVDVLEQQCPSKVTLKDLDLYLYSLQLSASRMPRPSTGDPEKDLEELGRIGWTWRAVVAERVLPYILSRIEARRKLFARSGSSEEPYFQDTVHRGLFVLRNVKS